METANPAGLPLREVIAGERVETDFQPVVSVKKKAVIGLEALSQGRSSSGERVSPDVLRAQAQNEGLGVELDRLFRKKALERFKTLRSREPDWLLFLNFDSSLVDQGVVGSGNIANSVKQLDLAPDNIVLEITESGVQDTRALKAFITTYRNAGFLVALDDIGSGHSNLNRIAFTRPDVLKITSSLIQNLDHNYYQREIFKSLVNLSKKIGALVVAEGVEREEEAMAALEMGADMLQGNYISEPAGQEAVSARAVIERVDHVASLFKTSLVDRMNKTKSLHERYDAMLKEMIREFSRTPAAGFDAKLRELAGRYPRVECLYILDADGVQVSDTVAPAGKTFKRNSLFRPAQKGADHSLKDYYYLLIDAFVNKFVTEPYVSLASGNLCITVSASFRDAQNTNRLLCLDLPAEEEE